MRAVLASAAAVGALTVVAGAHAHVSAPGPLHVHDLRATLVKHDGLYRVHVRARICVRSYAEAMNTYPSEIRFAHYLVDRKQNTWRAMRTTTDRAPWLVPVGETWNHTPCGDISAEDPIPATHYGVESLGNEQDCYDIRFTIVANARSASKRAIVTCGPRFR